MWNYVIPEPSNSGIMWQVSFQQDSAPAHFTLPVCEFLSESLTGQCIGWGCATSPLPLPRLPCSPNLSTPDNSVCTNSVLWAIVTDTCIPSTPWIPWKRSQRMWWCVKICEDHEGFPQGSAGSMRCGEDETDKQVRCTLCSRTSCRIMNLMLYFCSCFI